MCCSVVTVHKNGLPLSIDLSRNAIRTVHERAFPSLHIEKVSTKTGAGQLVAAAVRRAV